jgi:tetratricopeptide (TPR) repeat protein
MADWFRNTEWNAEIAAGFETRLARSRDKAQYLTIQAYTLIATHADVAAELARRAIALEDEAQTARAALYLGTALMVAGKPDEAIDALGLALKAQARWPMFRTGAALDLALAIAVTSRRDEYNYALELLAPERALRPDEREVTARLALALIESERGGSEDAAEILAMIEAFIVDGDGTESPGLPAYLNLCDIAQRLRVSGAGG